MAKHRHVDQVGVPGVHRYLADLPRVTKPGVPPGFSGVGRHVQAVARRRVAPDASLAGADVDDVGIGGGDGDSTDRACGQVVVCNRCPGHTGIDRLPHAATRGAHVVNEPLIRHTGHRHHASTSVGTDGSPLEGVEQLGVVAVLCSRLAERHGQRGK